MKKNKKFLFTSILLSLVVSIFCFSKDFKSNTNVTSYENNYSQIASYDDEYAEHHYYDPNGNYTCDWRNNPSAPSTPTLRIDENVVKKTYNFYFTKGEYVWFAVSGGSGSDTIYSPSSDGRLYGLGEYWLNFMGLSLTRHCLHNSNGTNTLKWVYGYDGYITGNLHELCLPFFAADKNGSYQQDGCIWIREDKTPETPVTPPTITDVRILDSYGKDLNDIVVEVGSTINLHVTVSGTSSNKKVHLLSYDDDIFTTNNLSITGVKTGDSKIKVYSDLTPSVYDVAKVHVIPAGTTWSPPQDEPTTPTEPDDPITPEDPDDPTTPDEPVVPEEEISEIQITDVENNFLTEKTIHIGETFQFYTYITGTAFNRSVTWESNNSNTFTVTNTGLVTGIAKGDGVLKITSAFDTSKIDTVVIHVIEQELETVAYPTYSNPTNRFTYNGKQQGLQILASTKYFTSTGTPRATNAGAYEIVYTCKPGYKLPNNETTYTLEWFIDRQRMVDDLKLNRESTTWCGSTRTVNVLNISEEDNGKWETVDDGTYHSVLQATNSGTYVVYVQPKSNFAWSNGSYNIKTLYWTISNKGFAKPQFKSNGTTSYSVEYSGNQTNILDNEVLNYDPILMNREIRNIKTNEILPDEPVDVGTYEIKYTLVNPTYSFWEDGDISPEEEVCLSLTISQKVVTIPTLKNASNTYDGNDFVPQWENFDTNIIETVNFVTNNEIGAYSIKLKLIDDKNYCWAFDENAKYETYGSDGQKYVLIDYTIGKLKLAKPTLKYQTTEYKGINETFRPTLNGFDDDLMDINVTKDPNNPYKFRAVVSLVYKGLYCWNNETTTDLVFDYSITKKVLSKPSIIRTEFNYDGKAKDPVLSGYDSNYMQYKKDPTKVESGTSDEAIELIDTTYTCWEGETCEDISFTFTIFKAVINLINVKYSQYVYTGSVIRPLLTEYDSSLVEVTYPEAINAGTYNIVLSLKNKENTQWADGSKEDKIIQYEIVPPTTNLSNDSTTSDTLWTLILLGIVGGLLLILFIIFFVIYIRKKRAYEYAIEEEVNEKISSKNNDF